MTNEPVSTPGPSPQQPAPPPSRTFRIAKRIGIALWFLCALVIPSFFPFIQPEPARWWKLEMIILFGLSWLALYVGLYRAILDNAKTGSPQAKFAKNVAIPALMAMLGRHHDAS